MMGARLGCFLHVRNLCGTGMPFWMHSKRMTAMTRTRSCVDDRIQEAYIFHESVVENSNPGGYIRSNYNRDSSFEEHLGSTADDYPNLHFFASEADTFLLVPMVRMRNVFSLFRVRISLTMDTSLTNSSLRSQPRCFVSSR